MTKKDELAHRRREIAEAAWRVLVRDGVRELSVRNVAAEAGLAPSSLRYVVPTQEGLREHAIDLVLHRMNARIDELPVAADEPYRARAILLELLPLDQQRRTEMEVYLALGSEALTDPALLPTYLRVHEAARSTCKEALHVRLGRAPETAEIDRLHGLSLIHI